MAAGINVTKTTVYVVLAKTPGTYVTKTVTYTVLAKRDGANVTKGVVYAVLAPAPQQQPQIFIVT